MAWQEKTDTLERWHKKAARFLWPAEGQPAPLPGWLLFITRVLYLAAHNALSHRLPFQANALTFMTLLSLVPMLAISFSVAKGLGFAETLRELLLTNEFLQNQSEILTRLLDYVDNTKTSTLGIIGLAMLIVTLILTLSSVEETFNRIWQVKVQRSFLRRITDYMSVLIIFPILIVAATALWSGFTSTSFIAWLRGLSVVGQMTETGMHLGPFVLIVAAFVFIYQFLPNTKVPLLPSLVAGIVASLLWWGVQSVYVYFQVGVARYNAIYGGFATLPLFMVWLQVSWMVLLFGAELAHAYASCRKGLVPAEAGLSLSCLERDALALRLLLMVEQRFRQGQTPWPCLALARALGVSPSEINSLVGRLQAKQVLTLLDGGRLVQPGRSLEKLTVAEVLGFLRGDLIRDEQHLDHNQRLVLNLLRHEQNLALEPLSKISLGDLLDRGLAAGGPEKPWAGF